MGVELATAWVRLVPTVEGIQAGIAKDLDANSSAIEAEGDRAGKKFSSGMKAALLGVGAIVAGAVAVGIGKAVTDASDLSETMNKSAVIFGDNAGAIEAFGNNAAKNIGLSKEAAVAAAAGFGDMFTQLGFATDQAAAMSQQALIAAADLGSFSNLDTADVSDRISAALRGEYDSLQAVIPNINAARVEQEALAATGKTVASSLTAQEKAAAVLAIVQKDGAKATGDFARTSDGLANQQKILDATMTNLSATIGSALIPMFNGVLSAAIPFFEWLTENQGVLVGVAAVIGVTLVAAFIAWTASIWAATAALLANPITWIVLAIVALIAAVVLLVMNWDQVVSFITDIWAGFIGWIRGVISGFVGWWNGIWAAVGNYIRQAWTNIVVAVMNAWNGLQSWLAGVIGGFLGWWNGIWSGIGNVIRTVFSSIGDFIGGIWNGIVSIIRNNVNTIIRVINGMIDGLNDLLSGIGSLVGLNLSLPKIPGLANGGTVTRPGTVLVGERGPELLNLPRGASVNPDISGGGGGKVVKIYPTFRQDDPRIQMRQWGREAERAFASQ